MAAPQQMISAQMPETTVRQLYEVRDWLQAQRPETVVSRSDAIRWCIARGNKSLAESTITAPLTPVTLTEDA